MQEGKILLPKWLLIMSGVFALLEIMASLALYFSPQLVLENVDLDAKGVDYLVYMWAARQFALGFIFGFATFKKSIPMLTLAYIFFTVMMIGDLIVGILQKDSPLIMVAILMGSISAVGVYVLNKIR